MDVLGTCLVSAWVAKAPPATKLKAGSVLTAEGFLACAPDWELEANEFPKF